MTDELQRLRVTLEWLEQDLANAIRLEPDPSTPWPATATADFKKDNILQFFTVREVSPLGAPPDQLQPEIRFVTYQRDGGTLKRSTKTIQEAQGGSQGTISALLHDLETFSMRYWTLDPGSLPATPPRLQEVVGDWDKADGLPRLVEVTITFGGSPPPPEIKRVFVIPAGTLPPP